MPNWCQNELQIFGPREDLQRFKAAAVGCNTWPTADRADKEQPSVLSFHTLDPIPPEVMAADYNLVGHPWELANWGCRWGCGDAVLVDETNDWLLYHFDTPWSQPVPFLKRLGPRWPSLTFVLTYEELGNAFKGICEIHNTKIQDHCLSLFATP